MIEIKQDSSERSKSFERLHLLKKCIAEEIFLLKYEIDRVSSLEASLRTKVSALEEEMEKFDKIGFEEQNPEEQNPVEQINTFSEKSGGLLKHEDDMQGWKDFVEAACEFGFKEDKRIFEQKQEVKQEAAQEKQEAAQEKQEAAQEKQEIVKTKTSVQKGRLRFDSDYGCEEYMEWRKSVLRTASTMFPDKDTKALGKVLRDAVSELQEIHRIDFKDLRKKWSSDEDLAEYHVSAMGIIWLYEKNNNELGLLNSHLGSLAFASE